MHKSGHGLLAAEVHKNVLRLLLALDCARLRRERLRSHIRQESMLNFVCDCSTGYFAEDKPCSLSVLTCGGS